MEVAPFDRVHTSSY